MIKPVNGHLLINPIAYEGFMASQREQYQEIGIVVDMAPLLTVKVKNPIEGSYPDFIQIATDLKVGDKVYFDSWLAVKYPKEGGKADEFFWLVKWEDVRAIEHAE